MLGSERALDGSANSAGGFSIGVSGSWGRRHRLTWDLGYGVVNAAGLSLEGILVDAVAAHGPFVHAGYEFLSAAGFFARVCPVGLGYTRNPLVPADRRLLWAGSVGLGWKLW